MTDDQDKKQFLQDSEVNGLYGITKDELKSLVDQGLLRALKDQGSYKYRRDEIERLIQEGVVKPLSDTVSNTGLFSGSAPIIPVVESGDDWGINEVVGSIAPAPNAETEIPVLELAGDDELVGMPVDEAEVALPIGELGDIPSDDILGKSAWFGGAPDTTEIPAGVEKPESSQDVIVSRPDSDSDVRIDFSENYSDSDVRIVTPELAQALRAAAPIDLGMSDSDVRLEDPKKTPSDSDVRLAVPKLSPESPKTPSDSDVQLTSPSSPAAQESLVPRDSDSDVKVVTPEMADQSTTRRKLSLSDSDSDVRIDIPPAPNSESDVVIAAPSVESLLGDDRPTEVSVPKADSQESPASSSASSSSRIESAAAEIEKLVGQNEPLTSGTWLPPAMPEPQFLSPIPESASSSSASSSRIESAAAEIEKLVGQNEPLTSGTWLPPVALDPQSQPPIPEPGTPSSSSMSAASSGRIEMAQKDMDQLLGSFEPPQTSSGSWMTPAVAPHELFPTAQEGSSESIQKASEDLEALSGVESRGSDAWLEFPPKSPAELMEESEIVYGDDSDSQADTAVRTKSNSEFVLEGFEPNAGIPSHVLDPSESGVALEASDSALYRREMLNDEDVAMVEDDQEEIDLAPADQELQLHPEESGINVPPSSFAGRPIDSGISFDAPDVGATYSSGILDDSMESGIRLQPIDSGLDLDSGESGIRLHADSGLALESQVGRSTLESGLALGRDSGLALGADDSGLALGADSGIALDATSDSGLSLEKAAGQRNKPRHDSMLTEEIILDQAEPIELADLATGAPANLMFGGQADFDESEDTSIRKQVREQGVLSTAFEMGDEVDELEVDDALEADQFDDQTAFEVGTDDYAGSDELSADDLEELPDDLVEADDEAFTEGVASADELELAPMAATKVRRGPAWPIYQTLMIIGTSVMLTINGVVAAAGLDSMWSGSQIASYAAGLVSALGNIL